MAAGTMGDATAGAGAGAPKLKASPPMVRVTGTTKRWLPFAVTVMLAVRTCPGRLGTEGMDMPMVADFPFSF